MITGGDSKVDPKAELPTFFGHFFRSCPRLLIIEWLKAVTSTEKCRAYFQAAQYVL
jgi:hypothetical protein